ncbi:MAG: hypothetical protein AABP62_18290 [Planctomycetota bacterium]
MPNIFEVYVNGYRALGELFADGLRELTDWTDEYISERGTNIVFNATIIDRGAAAASRLLVGNPRASTILKCLPVIKELAKVGFSMVARGRSFSEALGDRALSKSLDGVFDSSMGPERRAFYKSVIAEIVREGEAEAGM